MAGAGRGVVPRVWGIVNVTPDSFSDGGRHATATAAAAHARHLLAEGADVIDIGGESTRPGARPVPLEQELGRVVPVIRALAEEDASRRVSVDTRNAAVAREALAAGAAIVNDVSAGTHDARMFEVVAEHEAEIVLMHMRGTPETMQSDPTYEDVVGEVRAWLEERASAARQAGIAPARIWIDPGIGFGKKLQHNLDLMVELEQLTALDHPLLLGASRKSFLGLVTGRGVDERLAASLACAVRAAEAGAAAVRVHDVAATVDVLATWERIRRVAARATSE